MKTVKQEIHFRTILLATVGTSPAVLTETVWALAHPAKKSAERVIPDEIVVLTTLRGKAAVESQLLGSGGAWKRLVAALEKEGVPVAGKLAFGEASIRLLDLGKTYLEDIRTAEENEAVADLFLREIRGVTEDPKTRLFASIAGGRKTMGALLFSCMSLLGREQDHVLHVLVNEPFDSRLDPPFFFPAPKAKHVWVNPKTGGKKTFRAEDARLDLIDLPFVKMRGWYQDKFKTLPPRYSDLVRAAQSSGPRATAQKPVLRFDFKTGRVLVGRTRTPLSKVDAIKFLYLAAGLLRPTQFAWELLSYAREKAPRNLFGWDSWFETFRDRERSRIETKDPYGAMSRLRSELRDSFKENEELMPFVKDVFPLRERYFGPYPKERLEADEKAVRAVFGPPPCPGPSAPPVRMSADICPGGAPEES